MWNRNRTTVPSVRSKTRIRTASERTDGECISRWFHLGCAKCHHLQWKGIVSVYRSRAVPSLSTVMAFCCMTGTRIWRRTFKMHLLFNKMQCIIKTMHCYSVNNDVIVGKLLHIYLRDCWERVFINLCDAKQYIYFAYAILQSNCPIFDLDFQEAFECSVPPFQLDALAVLSSPSLTDKISVFMRKTTGFKIVVDLFFSPSAVEVGRRTT